MLPEAFPLFPAPSGAGSGHLPVLCRLLPAFGQAAPEAAAAMTTSTPAKSIGNQEYGVIKVGSPAVFARFTPEYQFVETIG